MYVMCADSNISKKTSKLVNEYIGIHFALTLKYFVFSPTHSFGECFCVTFAETKQQRQLTS